MNQTIVAEGVQGLQVVGLLQQWNALQYSTHILYYQTEGFHSAMDSMVTLLDVCLNSVMVYKNTSMNLIKKKTRFTTWLLPISYLLYLNIEDLSIFFLLPVKGYLFPFDNKWIFSFPQVKIFLTTQNCAWEFQQKSFLYLRSHIL